MVNDPTLVTIAPDIHVACDKGTVTLTGNVANQDQKQRIEYLAKGVTAVSTVNNQLQVGVSPTGRISQQTVIYSNAPQVSAAQPDSATAEHLYSSSGASSVSAIHDLPSYAAVAAALDASRSASSITNNNQDLSVQEKSSTPPATGVPSTAATTSAYATNSSVIPSDGSSVTSASVTSTNANAPQSPTEQKDLTPTSDRGSTGRVYATNQSANASSQIQPSADSSQTVEVRGTTDADKQIGAQFVQELKNEPSLASVTPSLRLSIENGKAILRGTVKSQDEKDKVEAIAKQVPGVNGVENQLTVGANGTSQINETR
jgi:osmotically-inducible protein OsmY